jgi:hypothetical protein
VLNERLLAAPLSHISATEQNEKVAVEQHTKTFLLPASLNGLLKATGLACCPIQIGLPSRSWNRYHILMAGQPGIALGPQNAGQKQVC